MTTSFARFASHMAAPVICAGAIGGAAIGLAGIAGGSTGSATVPAPNPAVRGPLIVATPQTSARHWVPPRHRVVSPRTDNGGE